MTSILVVEDDAMLRELICFALRKANYEVLEAKNGEEALRCFETEIFDLAILDINIGKGIDGFDVCKRIRRDLYGSLIPIVFMSGENDERSVVKGFQEGADSFIHKPCPIPELLARIQALLQRNQKSNFAVKALNKQNFKKNSIIEGKKDSYKIIKPIASGGMGAIFLAEKIFDGSKVAVKTIMPNQVQDESDLKRFLREADIAVQMSHPNIVRGIEVIRSSEYFSFVMEYIEGHTLEELLEINKKLSLDQAISVIGQIAEGLNYFDQKGILHRDVQPKNIVISEKGEAVLVDMGISKSKNPGSTITQTDIIMGTIEYLAPELIMSNKSEITSDIYSLGLTFFFALTGERAYGRENSEEAIFRKKFTDEISTEMLDSDLPESICKILEKMTFINPKLRYQKPVELIKDLQKVKEELN